MVSKKVMKYVPFTRAELISSINENRASIQKVKEAIEAWVDFLAAMEKKEKEMLYKYEQLERIDALIDNLKARIKAMVLLNLRGKVFAIDSQYLLSDELWCSYFPVMLLNEPDPKSGEYFIDCSSEGFDRILDCAKGEDMEDMNYISLDLFAISSTKRNILYLRLPYRSKYQFLGTFEMCCDFLAVVRNGWVVHNMIQLRDGRVVTTSNYNLPFGERGEMHIWNTTTFVCQQTLKVLYNFECLLQLQDGRLCCGCSSLRHPDGDLINIWDVNLEIVERTLRGHRFFISSLVQLADGRLCSFDKVDKLRVWDLTSGECYHWNIVDHDIGDFIMSTYFIQLMSGLVAVVGSADETLINLWDLSNHPVDWELVGTINTVDRIIHILELDNGNILSSHHGNFLKVWDVETGALLRSILHDSRGQFIELQDGRLCVDVQDGMKILSIESGEWEQTLLVKAAGNSLHDGIFLELQDGRLLTCPRFSLMIHVWVYQ